MVSNLAGLILCGGYSGEQSDDPGMQQQDDATRVEVMVRQFKEKGLKCFVSIREEQRPYYEKVLSKDMLILDKDFDNITGAIKGVLSAHKKHPNLSYLVMQASLTDNPSRFLKPFLEEHENLHGRFDFCIAKARQTIEPLLGIYGKSGLKKLNDKYELGILANKSVKSIIENSNSQFVDIREDISRSV